MNTHTTTTAPEPASIAEAYRHWRALSDQIGGDMTEEEVARVCSRMIDLEKAAAALPVRDATDAFRFVAMTTVPLGGDGPLDRFAVRARAVADAAQPVQRSIGEAFATWMAASDAVARAAGDDPGCEVDLARMGAALDAALACVPSSLSELAAVVVMATGAARDGDQDIDRLHRLALALA